MKAKEEELTVEKHEKGQLQREINEKNGQILILEQKKQQSVEKIKEFEDKLVTSATELEQEKSKTAKLEQEMQELKARLAAAEKHESASTPMTPTSSAEAVDKPAWEKKLSNIPSTGYGTSGSGTREKSEEQKSPTEQSSVTTPTSPRDTGLT